MSRPAKPPIDLQVKPIWKQQPNEPDVWYHRFNRWLRMIDPEQGIFKRSLRQIFVEEEMAKQKASRSKTVKNSQKNGKSQGYLTLPPAWSEAAKLYRWVDRKNGFDQHQQDIEDSLWDERMKNLREKRWTLAQTLFGKAETMAKMPLVKQTVTTNGPNGAQVTILEPVDWNLRDMVTLAKAGSDLAGEACGNLNQAVTLVQNAGFEVTNPADVVVEIPDIPEEELG